MPPTSAGSKKLLPAPSSAVAGDVRLLHDIETLSKALSLDQKPNTPTKKLPAVRSISAPKSHPSNPSHAGGKQNPARIKPEKSSSKAKKPSFWSSFNPIKSLSSQFRGGRRFRCQFSLHVHSVENLPLFFSDHALSVHWRPAGDPPAAALRTRPARVVGNAAEFDETLTCSSSVHGARDGGPGGAAKYEAKHFVISAVVVGRQDLDLGKNLIDLTRLLPLSLEELDQEEKNTGRWSTSFRLSGKAKGATLNVSFEFSVASGGDERGGNEKRLGRVRSLSKSRDPLRSVAEVKVLREVLPSSRSEAPALDHRIDEKKSQVTKLDPKIGFEEGLEESKDLNGLEGDGEEEKELEEPEFTVIEQGVEIAAKEQIGEPELEKTEFGAEERVEIPAENRIVEPKLEMIGFEADKSVEVITKDQLCEANDSENMVHGHGRMEDSEKRPNSGDICENLVLEELDYALNSPPIIEWEKDMESVYVQPKTPDEISYSEMRQNYKSRAVKSKSLSLDEETVTSEFLSMLGIDNSPAHLSSDSVPESPRTRLWNQFKEETLSTGNNLFGIGIEQAKEPDWMEGDFAEDFDLALMVQEAEMELQKASEVIDTKSRAKMLEDAETEALMREWGLNEKAFHNSPPSGRSGFGSPIDVPPEDPPELPPLGEGLGPFVQTKDGGFLRSMSPSIFKNAKNNGSLVMQVSSPVVVPAEMGSGIMEILQRLASVGIEKLSMQAKKLMPLEDVTGQTMQQLAWEAAPSLKSCERQDFLRPAGAETDTGINQFASRRSKKRGSPNIDSATGKQMNSEYVSLEDLAPLAMDKIEALSIEGQRIQSGMSDEEAPSNVSPQSIGDISALEGKGAMNSLSLGLEGTGGLQLMDVNGNGDDIDGLMGLSITLDEWMRLDSGMVDDEDVVSERTSKILAAHHARSTEVLCGDKRGGKRSGRKWGLLGNTFTVALMVQLRDPLRDYEPVGTPMLSLIQVERVFVPPKPKIYSSVSEKGNSEEQDDEHDTKTDLVAQEEKKEDDVVPQFKITEVHVAGIKTEPDKKKVWGNPAQQQSGSRWLLASGMGKSKKHPLMKSKPVSKLPSPVTTTLQPGDTLWSISSRVHGDGAKGKGLLSLNPHIRNPNVIFLDQKTRLR